MTNQKPLRIDVETLADGIIARLCLGNACLQVIETGIGESLSDAIRDLRNRCAHNIQIVTESV